jgi:hypothetical protein
VTAARDGRPCSREVPGPDKAFYDLALDSGSVRFPAVYIGVVGGTGRFVQDGSRLIAHVDRREPPDEFEVCTSNEGVHFTAWNGPMLRGQRIWHRYYYVGYDLEPDCTGPEYR